MAQNDFHGDARFDAPWDPSNSAGERPLTFYVPRTRMQVGATTADARPIARLQYLSSAYGRSGRSCNPDTLGIATDRFSLSAAKLYEEVGLQLPSPVEFVLRHGWQDAMSTVQVRTFTPTAWLEPDPFVFEVNSFLAPVWELWARVLPGAGVEAWDIALFASFDRAARPLGWVLGAITT